MPVISSANAPVGHPSIGTGGEECFSPRAIGSRDRAEGDAPATQGLAAHRRQLTARQREVLMALRSGASNKEIGRKLSIREDTVKVHLRSIFQQLGVKNRTQAAMVAVHDEQRAEAQFFLTDRFGRRL
ncbi:MAG: LuxR C-terminal-related transcriptional regulator [Rhodospirillales bacterium]|nr:LuxR C-terminal-related transcriptional regulator [Rhodospirillales bacterium]